MHAREQDAFVSQLAWFMVELSGHRFASIGSLSLSPSLDAGPDPSPGSPSVDRPASYTVCPLVRRPFLADGRAPLALDRGPFPSARAYYRACAQRELACARTLDVDSEGAALPSYRQSLEANRRLVERCAELLEVLVDRCEGLAEDADEGIALSDVDEQRACFSLDMHDIGLKNILVDPNEHSKIVGHLLRILLKELIRYLLRQVCITDWQFVNTRPLWCCARTPAWLRPSLSLSDDDDCGDDSEAGKARLTAVFRQAAAAIPGPDAAAFVRALDGEDDAGAGAARCTLDDLADYDAFRDAFLLLPALENILATLPGQEDVAGLTALLDPSTLPGRVARINLLTRGSNALFLAMTPPRRPSPLPADAESEVRMNVDRYLGVDGPVLVHATG
ncbi:hypothetical protein EIP86_005942 [Pleurotus ostreatoroseus]|nr:hypothetical protein EIP86_005942 [Pleurotus ostreatoroseus]